MAMSRVEGPLSALHVHESVDLCVIPHKATKRGFEASLWAAFVALCGITRSRAPIGLCPQQIAKHLDKHDASPVVDALQVIGEIGEPHFVLGISEGNLPAKPIVSE
jgi:hypothetical protein